MPYGDDRQTDVTDTWDTSISGSWANGYGDWGTYTHVGSGFINVNTEDESCAMRYDDFTPTDDQWGKVTVDSQDATGSYISAGGRLQDGAAEASYTATVSSEDDEYQLYEFTEGMGGGVVASTSDPGSEIPFGSGDFIVIECRGTTILVGSNAGGTDAQKISHTDSTLSSGKIGIGGFEDDDAASSDYTAFEGGDIDAGPDITASGAATAPAVVAAGVAKVRKPASGGATLPAVEAAGVAQVHRAASGGATLPSVEAAGVATVRKAASGGATLPPIEAAGVAKVRHLAGGSATLGPVEAAGVAKVHRAASGDATLPSVEAAGIATVRRNASGAALLPSIIAAGVAKVHRAASGAATLPAIVAAGVASVEEPVTASGDATLPAVEGAGVAKVHRGASGGATLPAVQAVGVAQIRRVASGSATLPAVEGAGVAQVRKPASGGASIPSPVAAGVATVRHTAFGAVTLPSVVAAGVAVAGINRIVDYEQLEAREIAVSLEARYYGDIDLSASAFAVDLEAKK